MRVLAPLAVVLCAAGGWTAATPPDAVDFTGFDVVIMGEVHDNPTHHANQAAWIARLDPGAVVFEMLTSEQAPIAQSWQGDIAGLGEALQWNARGWPDFALYAPIFEAIPAGATIKGAEVSRDALRAAMRDGAAAVHGKSAAMFGLDVPLAAPEQAAREADMAASHCGALPPAALPGMIEAQRLRDAALAEAVFAALHQNSAPVAVITGNGHARTDWGLSVPLRVARPDLKILSIGQFESVQSVAQPFDLYTVAAAPNRPGDPCDAFR